MAANDDMKQFEDELERKWNNWDRIQKRMAEREAQRKKPKSGYEPPQKQKLKEKGTWKQDYANLQSKTQQEIDAKYKEKKAKDKAKREKEEKKVRAKVNKDGTVLQSKSKDNHGLSKPPPKTSNFAVNYAREQKKLQAKIDEKYAKQKEKEKEETAKMKAKVNEKYKNKNQNKDKNKNKNKNKNDLNESKSDIDNDNIEAKLSDEEIIEDEKTKAKKKEIARIQMIIIGPNDTPIKAVKEDEFDKIRKYALSYKSQLNQKDKLKYTVLHHCCLLGRYEMLEYLLKHVLKSIINTTNFDGNTALMVSIEHGCDAQGRYNPRSALNKNKFKCFQVLMNTKLKGKQTDLNITNVRGFNALTYATLHKDINVLKELLKHEPKPDFEIKTRQSKTALSIAVEYCQIKKGKESQEYETMAMMLLQAGASHQTRDNQGRTIEQMATGKIAKFIRDKNYQTAINGLTDCGLVLSTQFLMDLIIIIADFTA